MRIEILHNEHDELFLEGDINTISNTMDIIKLFINNHIIDIEDISSINGDTILIKSKGRDKREEEIKYHFILRKVRGMDIKNRFRIISSKRRWLRVRFKIYYNRIIIYPYNIFLRIFYRMELEVGEADIELIEL